MEWNTAVICEMNVNDFVSYIKHIYLALLLRKNGAYLNLLPTFFTIVNVIWGNKDVSQAGLGYILLVKYTYMTIPYSIK